MVFVTLYAIPIRGSGTIDSHTRESGIHGVDAGIVGRGRGVRGCGKGRAQFVEAIAAAGNVAVAVHAQSQRRRQVGQDLPLILDIEAHAVHFQGFGPDVGEGLRVSRAIRERAVHEIGHRVEHERTGRIGKRGVGADIILAQVQAGLKDMLAKSNGVVVDQLMLPDLAALGIVTVAAAHVGVEPISEFPCGWESLDGGGKIREDRKSRCNTKRTGATGSPRPG